MNIKKIGLAATTFMLAISAAFATQLLVPEDGYTKLSEGFPGQTEECELQVQCSNTGTFPCKIKFSTSPTEYNLYRLVGTECPDQLINEVRVIVIP